MKTKNLLKTFVVGLSIVGLVSYGEKTLTRA
jgi:hypothetical protein